ncbi:histidinol-phosphate aminotransferase [Aquimarina sp. MAR_2010_214]|uniref:histidinol-phosphate transaminase n=1 Tax=Aquimarina sp. MAR_2010_214 TaxID=1250026 RepID=UPI000C70564E|nr:histidinol-phosphate transaminase [Aquimarina sp. MAR_2010_214]PKV51157.1 histidinol-phosphate aminotransferase [Aquimarina sp. MAR_2010_214]
MKKTQFNIKQLVRKNILHLKPYSSARDEFTDFDQDMVFLDANENPYENGVNRYPDPQQKSLKKIIANQRKVSETNILLGNGSDEVLDLIFRAFCEPGIDNIITMPPTYGMYKVLANINNVEEQQVWLGENFQPDVEAILAAENSNSKLLFICSPNNPSGNLIEQQRVEELLERFNGLVIIDEAYIDFTDRESWVGDIYKYPNLIVTQTLSKAYGLAGIRLGICYASEEIINVLNKIKPPYNVNELTQQRALQRVIEEDQIKDEVSIIIEGRAHLEEALSTINFVEKIFRSDANFILVRVDDANKRYDQLIKHGIVVRNRSTQPLCENTLRFTVGTEEENKKLIQILMSISKS